MRTLLGTLMMVVVAAPALAVDQFYIVRDPVAKRCTVVNERPTLSTTSIVGAGYRTRAEADAAMKAAGVCAGE